MITKTCLFLFFLKSNTNDFRVSKTLNFRNPKTNTNNFRFPKTLNFRNPKNKKEWSKTTPK